jgi:RNA polymerase sigma-70 factor, ECF subfamily
VDRARAPLSIVPPPTPTGVDAAYRDYSRYVATIAFRLLGREDEVDDVVQDVFLSALDGLSALRDPEAAKGWLATVTVRIALRKLRFRRVRSFLGLDSVVNYKNVAIGAKQEQAALLGRVYRILDDLPAAERVAWVLRNVEGEPLESVATACDCSLATAKRRITAAQEKITRAVQDA